MSIYSPGMYLLFNITCSRAASITVVFWSAFHLWVFDKEHIQLVRELDTPVKPLILRALHGLR